MRATIYCSETFEALTIIKLESWALRMLDQGCVFLRFAPVPAVPVTPIFDADMMLREAVTFCTIRFDPIRLRDMQTWIGVTDDQETSLQLRSVFLPGQQSEVREAERDAQLRLMADMLSQLSR